MRKINEIILHCTATTKDPSAKTIDKWHKDQGWAGIGYHFLIRKDGTLEKGRDLEQVGAHCKNKNKYSIGIALNGLDVFYVEQFKTCAKLIAGLQKQFGELKISGHNQYSTKLCPVFNIEIIKGMINEIRVESPSS